MACRTDPQKFGRHFTVIKFLLRSIVHLDFYNRDLGIKSSLRDNSSPDIAAVKTTMLNRYSEYCNSSPLFYKENRLSRVKR